MTTRDRIVEGDGDPRHGTTNGYSNLRCRCDDCRDAACDAARVQREARKVLCPVCRINRHDPARTHRGRPADRCVECYRDSARRPCPSIAHYHAGCRCDLCRELARTIRTAQRRRSGVGTVRGWHGQRRNQVAS